MLTAEAEITPQFYDLDPMNVVWHGNYPRFLEQTRCLLLDGIGYGYARMSESGYAWPIVGMGSSGVIPSPRLTTRAAARTGSSSW